MSGLLPSTITKWFSSPSSSNANGSATVVDATDSSTEDEAPDSPTIQPPTKRMRLSPSASNHFRVINTKCSSTNTETSDFIQTPMINSPNKCSFYKRDSSFMSTPFNTKPDETTLNMSESENRVSYILKNSLSSGDTPMAKSRKSLFNTFTKDKPTRNEGKSYSDQPKDVNRSYNTSSLLGSPFYPGQTTYGGAANSLNSNYKVTNINKNTVVNKTKSNESLDVSHSARRIMDLLENYSSPLAEARRISQYVKPDKSLSTPNANPDCKKVISYKTQELYVPSIASILSIKRRSRLMDTTSAARQLLASHSSSTNVSPYPTKSESSQGKDTKFVTKIKKCTRKNKIQAVNNLKGFVTPKPLDLPTAVLQIDKDNLPKFSFDTPLSKPLMVSNISSPLHSSVKVINTVQEISEPDNVNVHSSMGLVAEQSKSVPVNSYYTFSKPVTVSNESITSNKLPKYTFLSPEKTVDVTKVDDTKNYSVSSIVGTSQTNDVASTNTSNWKCNDCWVSNKPDVNKCVCCGGKKPVTEETRNCSVCKAMKCLESSDVCSGCKKIPTNNISKSDSSKWKCNDCWVSNDSKEEKCVCCGGIKPGKSSDKPKPELPLTAPMVETSKWKCEDCWISNDINADKCVCCGGKKPANKTVASKPDSTDKGWKCNVCLLENKSSAEKCIACLTSKPGLSSATKPLQNSSPSNFQSGSNDLIKKVINNQLQKWECQYCLVHNENDKSRCVCCDSEKPGAAKQQPESKFNFGISPSTTFKFGIDPKIATVKEKVDDKKPEVKETNNNELPKVSFTFGITPSKTDSIVSNDKEKPKDKPVTPTQAQSTAPVTVPVAGSVSAPTPAFSFGIPKEIQNKTSVSNEVTENKLSEPVTKPETEKNEKPQEVPNIDNNETPKAKLQFSSTLFSNPAPPSAQTLPATTASGTLSLNSSANVDAKPGLSDLKPVNIPASTSMSLTNFFKPPVSTAVESIPSFAKTVDSSSINSNTALFQKSEPLKTGINFTAPPLFQKNTVQQPTTASPLFQKIDTQNSANTTISPFQKNELPAPTSALFQQSEPAATTSMSLFSAGTAPISSTPSLFPKNDPPTTQTSTSSAPIFSFRLNTQSQQTSTEKPKFNFSFGNNNKIGANMFTNTNTNAPAFGGITDSPNKFGAPPSTTGGITNVLSPPGGNGLASSNILGGNGLGTMAGSNMSSQSMNSRNTLQSNVQLPTAPSGLFGTTPSKDANAWPSTNNAATNMFATTSSTNTAQKPATFTFGNNNMSFNMINNTSVPVFGGSAQPTPNVFGMPNPSTNNTPSMFSSPVQNQSTPSMFGSPQPANNPAPTIGLFGQQNVTPTFGSTPSSFEQPQNPTPAPAFNFGSSQPSGVFGFGQQTTQQPQQGGVYNFGAGTPAAPQVQFSVGSAPNTGTRRVRKAVRRTTQR